MELWSWIVLGILSLLAILGNGGVILMIITRKRLHRTSTNWFILSLATADFFFGALYLILDKLSEYFKERDDAYSRFYCFQAKNVLGTASVTNLCAMTLDRYLAIVHPLRYVTFMKKTRVGLLITVAWLLALVRSPLHLGRINALTSEAGASLIKLDIVIYQALPGIALFLATVHILLIVRRHSKQKATLLNQLLYNYPTRSRQDRKQSLMQVASSKSPEANSAKVVSAIVAVFLSYLGLKVFIQLHYSPGYYGPAYSLFQVFMIANSAFNPIAYAFYKADIRRELRRKCGSFRKTQPRVCRLSLV